MSAYIQELQRKRGPERKDSLSRPSKPSCAPVDAAIIAATPGNWGTPGEPRASRDAVNSAEALGFKHFGFHLKKIPVGEIKLVELNRCSRVRGICGKF
jgi:hypothetical protein